MKKSLEQIRGRRAEPILAQPIMAIAVIERAAAAVFAAAAAVAEPPIIVE